MSVAVVIPHYNRPELLLRALRSIQAQTFSPSKVLIVDDASIAYAEGAKVLSKSSGFRWIDSTENLGPAAARNAGACSSREEWIMFLDSDDEWLPGKIERQMEWHRDHPDYRISQVEESWFRNDRPVTKKAHQMQQGGDLFAVSCQQCAISPSCVAIRRDLWEETGGFDERYRVCEDYELWLRITLREEVGLVPATLVHRHGGHSDQLSTTTPAMDRWRVAALLERVASGELSLAQKEIALGAVREKSRVLSAGARKRGNSTMAELYGELIRLSQGLSSEELEDLIGAVWGTI